jgi:hypothetical protein
MAEATFRPPSAPIDNGTVTLNTEWISGQGGSAFSFLTVSPMISLKSVDPQMQFRPGGGVSMPKEDDPIQDYTLHRIYGNLFFMQRCGPIPFHSFPLSLFSRPEIKNPIPLSIPLNAYQLRQIEEQRVGDLSLRFDFTFEFAKHCPVSRKQSNPPIEKFEATYLSMGVNIPRSDWVDKVLPSLGYGKIYLVEVPTPEKAFDGTIVGVVEEFQHAQQHMLHGDYNKTLNHCRNALERLSNMRKYEGSKNPPSFADKIDYLLTVLPGAPTGARREHLARLLKDLYGLTSMPEHPSPPHFTRDDAEMTLLNTVAVLSYIGKFFSRAE